jgi:hypothetical protein
MSRHSASRQRRSRNRKGRDDNSRHRTVGISRRGIAGWPVVALAMAALLGLAWVGWGMLGSALDRRAAADAGQCVAGAATLSIATAPSAAEAVTQAVEAWNATKPVIADTCFRAQAHSVPPDAALNGLAGTWDTARWGPRPAAWIPDSTSWVDQLIVRNPHVLGSMPADVPAPTPHPFVAIAADGDDAPVQAAQEFRTFIRSHHQS